MGLFLNEDTKRAAGRVAASFPPVKDIVKIRTKYFDDRLEQQLRSGVRQVVLLGAGLDTRAVRKRAPGVTYFEIDEAATLEVKRACYERRAFRSEPEAHSRQLRHRRPDRFAREKRFRLRSAHLRHLGGQHDVPAARLHEADPRGAQALGEAILRVVRLHGGVGDLRRRPAIRASRGWSRALPTWARRGCRAFETCKVSRAS